MFKNVCFNHPKTQTKGSFHTEKGLEFYEKAKFSKCDFCSNFHDYKEKYM